MDDLTILIKDTEVGLLTYGVKDLNLTLRGDGDMVLATDDGVLTVRAPGLLKGLLEAAMEGIAEQKATGERINGQMQGIQERLRQLREGQRGR